MIFILFCLSTGADQTEAQMSYGFTVFFVLFCKGCAAVHFTLAKECAFVYAPTGERQRNRLQYILRSVEIQETKLAQFCCFTRHISIRYPYRVHTVFILFNASLRCTVIIKLDNS